MCTKPWTRRRFLSNSTGAAALVALGPSAFRIPRLAELAGVQRPFLEVALQAWRWIESTRVETDHGVTWPADPSDPASVGSSLYTHGPGVLPFALELFHTTQDERYLDEAKRGADHLARTLTDVDGAGLYTGLAGIAFVLAETYRASGDASYRDAAMKATELILLQARPVGSGVAWPQAGGDGEIESNDIISGTAGTGLGLLYLHRTLDHDEALKTAIRAGWRLMERRIDTTDGGARWDMWPGYAREMPNFSHGTAGIAYFLGTLARPSGMDEFRGAAMAGARYLTSIATVENGGYRIYHSKPGGEDLYYLSWCHGPVGTNRLFYRLHRATGANDWMDWVHRGAQGIMATGIPETRTPGFWENISQCGGNAGVGEHFLALHRVTGRDEYRAFVDRLNDDLLDRSSEEAGGRRWVQSEHRVRPELLVAQTGFMQGAAGVGKWLLHVDAMDQRGAGPAIVLPDAPH